MPVTVDHDVRRREVAEAVWRVLADTGFAGLSLRAVAKEMGATTGLLTHYFRSKRELVQHALEVVHERTVPRMREAETPDHGVDGLRIRLRAVLIDDDEATVLSKVWVGFWDLALADAELSLAEAARYERWRQRLRPLVDEAIAAGRARGRARPRDGGRRADRVHPRAGGPGAVRPGPVPCRTAVRRSRRAADRAQLTSTFEIV